MSEICELCGKGEEEETYPCLRCGIYICLDCSGSFGPSGDYDSAFSIRRDVLFELSCYFPFGVDNIILDYTCWPVFPFAFQPNDDGRICDRCTGVSAPSNHDLLQEALKLLGITEEILAPKVRTQLSTNESKRARQAVFDALCLSGKAKKYFIRKTHWVDARIELNKDRPFKRMQQAEKEKEEQDQCSFRLKRARLSRVDEL